MGDLLRDHGLEESVTWLEGAVYATGVAAVLSAIPFIRTLRSNQELARARVFLRWRSYTRTLRVVGLVGAVFIAVLLVDNVLEPDDYLIRTFVPVGVFQLMLQSFAIYYGWTIATIARGPRSAPAGLLLLLAPIAGVRVVVLATGIPAVAALLLLTFRIPYESEVVKARYYLQFRRTNRVAESLVAVGAAGLAANLAYFVANPAALAETGYLAPTGVGILIVHVAFLFIAGFTTFMMRGLLLRGPKPG